MRKPFFLLILLGITSQLFAQLLDVPFRQATSVKFSLSPELEDAQLRKVRVDYNDIVYVLTNQGLYREYPNHLLAKDMSYRSLSDKIPVDIALQEESGILFYLYPDQYLTNGYAGTVYGSLPANTYDRLAINASGKILLMGPDACAIFEGREKVQDLSLPGGSAGQLYTYRDQFYVLHAQGIYRLEDNMWELLHAGAGLNDLSFWQNEIYLGTDKGIYAVSIYDGAITRALQSALPVPQVTQVRWVKNQCWMGSPDGAFLQEGPPYRYFAGPRWLDQNRIVDLAADSRGDIYLLTPTGLNKIEYRTHTLASKAAYFQDRIRQRFMRYGFVCAPRLSRPYDETSAEVVDHDNDGLWTSFYLGSQAFRYATTGEPLARRYVWESFAAFERLITVNPLEGFPSRTFERSGYWVADPDRWRSNSPDPGWDWKGTTSTDEYISYLFVAAVMDQLVVENEQERQRVAGFIDAIMTHILDHDLYFVDDDGQPTLWGRWNPEYVNQFPRHVFDRKLNSTHLIAGLQLAYALTGKPHYKTEAFRIMESYGYFENMLVDMYEMRADTVVHEGVEMGDSWNHSDDEMAFLTYWPLYHYAFNDTLKAHYVDIIRNHWEIELPERNALWNLITFGTAGDMRQEDVQWHLQEFLIDQMSYPVRNAHRKDLSFLAPNFRGQLTAELLTPGERRIHRHNANPFVLDGGSPGTSMLCGDEFLLPYWMGRYLGVIQEP